VASIRANATRANLALPEREAGTALPGTAEVAPEQKARRREPERREICLQLRVQGPRRAGIDLVLHRDVRAQHSVRPEQAKALYDDLAASFAPERVPAVGLGLWRYLGGPWEPVERFAF